MMNFHKNRSLINGMPNMSETLDDWEIPLTFIKVTQKVVEGKRVTTETLITFMGVFQPLRDEQLQSKNEQMRSWQWYWVHAKSGSVELNTQDIIRYNGHDYKVMSVKDYSLNGFVEYEIVKDYQYNE